MSDVFGDLFVFEMANNHEGQLEHGPRSSRAMAEIARRYRIRGAIKFQDRDLDTLIHPAYRERQDVKHIPRFFRNRLSESQFSELTSYARQEGLLPVVTP